jgi:hypothetical protein
MPLLLEFTQLNFPLFNNPTVLLVEIFNISETPINKGLLSSITQPRGATDVSQAVKAKRASIVLSGETPGKDELKFLHQQPYCLRF